MKKQKPIVLEDKTQQELIIEVLKRGWTSPLDALRYAGTMKLATRVGELRRAGNLIIDKWHESRRYKMYRLTRKAK